MEEFTVEHAAAEFHDKAWWNEESQKYYQLHYRLVKCARIVNQLVGGMDCDLLDIGCGPATLSKLLKPTIHYYGIDLVIHDPSPNLLEIDLVNNGISFQEKSFDFIVAQGFFEYIGANQHKKFTEIKNILKPGGKFVASYVNFSHFHKQIYPMYNNVMQLDDFIKDIKSVFKVEKCFPSSYNWMGTEPKRTWLKRIQLPIFFNIPFFCRQLGVQYFFICS